MHVPPTPNFPLPPLLAHAAAALPSCHVTRPRASCIRWPCIARLACCRWLLEIKSKVGRKRRPCCVLCQSKVCHIHVRMRSSTGRQKMRADCNCTPSYLPDHNPPMRTLRVEFSAASSKASQPSQRHCTAFHCTLIAMLQDSCRFSPNLADELKHRGKHCVLRQHLLHVLVQHLRPVGNHHKLALDPAKTNRIPCIFGRCSLLLWPDLNASYFL